MHAYSLLVGTRVPVKVDIKAKGVFLQQMKASTEDIANAKTTTRLDNRATKKGLASEKNETSNLIFFLYLGENRHSSQQIHNFILMNAC